MKKLHTGQSIWPIYNLTTHLHTSSFPIVEQTKVVIVGGGMSGLLTAYQLWLHNVEFVLVEANQIASGSTQASTGLLQYCSDITLPDLRSRIGKEGADSFYKASYLAIHELEQIAAAHFNRFGDADIQRTSSFQYASEEKDIVKLQAQYSALSELGLPCELWGRQKIEATYPFSKPFALVTHDDARMNPYLFVRFLADFLLEKGALLYEHAVVTSQTIHEDEVILSINQLYEIKASFVIYAVGYQPEQLQQEKIKPILNRTYVIATNPIPNLHNWYDGKLIWETAKPYFYMRTTKDNRFIVGGLDEPQQTPNDNIKAIAQHNHKLLNELLKLFPFLDAKVEYAWNATFAESFDQLPFIGPNPQHKQILYLCGYGGNGTVYSVLGAKLLAAYIKGEDLSSNKVAKVLSLNREK